LSGVSREIEFRFHTTAFAEDGSLTTDQDAHYGQAQVEDWSDLRRTMDVVASRPRELPVVIGPSFTSGAELSLDGVHLGLFRGTRVVLSNIQPGRHELMARPLSSEEGIGGSMVSLEVPPRDPVPEVTVEAGEGPDSEARFNFWVSLMSAFHRGGATPLAHLEHVAAMSGYPPLPVDTIGAVGGDLEGILFWVQGLGHHLDFRGGDFGEKGATDPKGTWLLAKEVIELAELTFVLLVDLPHELMKAGAVTIELLDAEGRAGFKVRCRTATGSTVLIDGIEDGGGTVLRFHTRSGVVVQSASDIMTALAIIGSSLTLGFDVVELAEAIDDGDGTRIAWAGFDMGVDMAQMVLCALKFMGDLGLITMTTTTRSLLTVVGAAISVVAIFLDAYRDAGGDFWGAWDLLLHPDGFSDALRTAGFFSAVASLVTTAVVTAALPVLTGATLAGAFSVAILAATGVGLIVFGAILALWAIFNWDKVRGWFSGTADGETVADLRKDLEGLLEGTMALKARLNVVDIDAELQDARSERGIGLALMNLKATLGDEALVSALGNADLYHLDGGSAKGRQARAVCEMGHWIEVFWREVDDLVDNDRPNGAGECSEGFRDYKGSLGSKDLDFDADIRIAKGGSDAITLTQADGRMVQFLRTITETDAAETEVRLRIDGEVYEEALKDWTKALGAVSGQISEVSNALGRASRESAFVASAGPESAYDRDRALVEVRLPKWMTWARLEVSCQNGGVIIDGKVVEGTRVMEVNNGTMLVTVTGMKVSSRVLDYEGDGSDKERRALAECIAFRWSELGFGDSILDHSKG
jgi:hypothetical protein